MEDPIANFWQERLHAYDLLDNHLFEVWLIDGEILPVTTVAENLSVRERFVHKDHNEIGTLNVKNSHCLALGDGYVTPFGAEIAHNMGLDPTAEALQRFALCYYKLAWEAAPLHYEPDPAPARS